LFPLSTIGFMIAPWSLMRTIGHAKALVEPTFPMLEQFALTDFIVEGHLERHIKRSREIYMKRRQALLFAISRHLGSLAVLNRESGGFQQCLQIQSNLSEQKLLELALQAGLPMVATASEYASEPPRNEFMISFAHLDEAEVEEHVMAFAAAIHNQK
jgi:GntR family transcriptional regulator/MocR family aminotransferase